MEGMLCGHLLDARRTGTIFNLCYFLCIFNLSKIRTKLLLKTKALNFFLIIHGARTIATSHIS